MHYWWKNVVRDYLTFSQRDKVGITIIVLVIITLIVLPRFFVTPSQKIDKQAFIQEVSQLNISVENNSTGFKKYNNDDENEDHFRPKRNSYETNLAGELFAFNPNTLNAAGWKRLGLRDKTIETIQHFLQKGYKFRQPEDLKKIYGLKKELAERLIPYVQIEASNNYASYKDVSKPIFENTNVIKKSALRIIDINQADTSDFVLLRGIGSKLASRIVAFRNKLGGFTSVNQIGETYGLPDSTFKTILPQLQCDDPQPQTININLADAGRLKLHPYISWNIANAIVRYREQHGKFLLVSDLQKIEIINQEIYNKISTYLVVE